MGIGREYPPEFWGFYANRAQGGGGLSVEDAFAEWQAEQEKEWQDNQKALREAGKISSGEQEWPRMSVADDLTAQTDSLARTNAEMYAWMQNEKEREAQRRQAELEKEWEKKDYIPEGTLLSSRDAGANAVYIDKARNLKDVTEKLNNTMAESERKYGRWSGKSEPLRAAMFYRLVRGGGEYDLKDKPEWKGDERYIYNGEVVKRDVPGNIHYGHFGKVFGYPDEILKAGAGAYQMWTDPSQIKNFDWNSYGDDPRDTARIQQGIDIYRKRR